MTRFTPSSKTFRTALATAVLFAGLSLQASGAFAVSASVKIACLGDYLNYCSQHKVGSQALRSCMRSNGLRLSKRCVNALVGAGEVSKAEVARRAAGK